MNYKKLICKCIGHDWDISAVLGNGIDRKTERRVTCKRCGCTFQESKAPYSVTITESKKVRTERFTFEQLKEVIRDFNGSADMSKLIITKIN
jgi:hypothetical protein